MRYIFMVFKFFMIVAIVGLYACNGQVSKSKENGSINTFTEDVPLDSKGDKVLGYHFARQMSTKLKLKDITHGFDSMQLRIWYSSSSSDTGRLVILKNYNNAWSAELYSYIFLADSLNDTLFTVTNEIPKSGWKNFTKKLFKLEVLTLPDMDKLIGSDVIHGGDVSTVEVATKHIYRLYQYITPYKFEDSWNEAKQMNNILKLIAFEFE